MNLMAQRGEKKKGVMVTKRRGGGRNTKGEGSAGDKKPIQVKGGPGKRA